MSWFVEAEKMLECMKKRQSMRRGGMIIITGERTAAAMQKLWTRGGVP